MRGLSTRRFFAFGLAAAGAVPLASRLRFRSANAIGTPARAFPIAPVVPKTFTAFDGVRIDNYDWLRDRQDPRVIAYLNAENAYADTRLESIKPLVDELAAELRAREAQEDASVPTAYNDYVYERRFAQGAHHPGVGPSRHLPLHLLLEDGRHQGLDNHGIAACVLALDLPTTAVQVTDHVADIWFGGHHLDLHHRL